MKSVPKAWDNENIEIYRGELKKQNLDDIKELLWIIKQEIIDKNKNINFQEQINKATQIITEKLAETAVNVCRLQTFDFFRSTFEREIIANSARGIHNCFPLW